MGKNHGPMVELVGEIGATVGLQSVQWRPMAWVVKEEFGDHADVVFPKGLWGLTSAFALD
jgi:hypothetical protein